jgi:hypothetical protein
VLPIAVSLFLAKTKHVRSTDYAVNIQCVLAFMTCGDGGCEAQKILGMLDLPNKTAMEKKTFSSVEWSIVPHIKAMAM